MNQTINVRMLGSFTIELNGQLISDRDNHSRKMWVLLAYLIYFHEKKISQNELFSTIWEKEEDTGNPANVLKVLLHRTRSLLNELDPSLGKQFILCKNGEYYLNPEISFRLDAAEFETKMRVAQDCNTPQKKLALYREAVALYQGNFLEKFVTESWIIPLATYYRGMYLELLHDLIAIYETDKQYEEIIQLCRNICPTEKYDESFYLHYMNSLILTGQYQEAIQAYDGLRDILYAEFGIRPSDELQALFRKARQGIHTDIVDIADIPRLMSSSNTNARALYCEVDIFKQIYLFSARGLERNGGILHFILLNIADINLNPLPKRSLTICVKNLKEWLCSHLRCGDIISMCSPSQFMILLPNANYENTEKVMQRIETGFYQQYPHTPAKLCHYIQPVTPYSDFLQN